MADARTALWDDASSMFYNPSAITERDGFQLYTNLDPADSHLRATITVVDSAHRVIGFISRPENVAGLKIIQRGA